MDPRNLNVPSFVTDSCTRDLPLSPFVPSSGKFTSSRFTMEAYWFERRTLRHRISLKPYTMPWYVSSEQYTPPSLLPGAL